MKQIFLFTCILMLLHFAQAQSTGDYRSFTTGSWDNPSTWERFDGTNWVSPAPAAPSSSDGVITIRNSHNVTVNSGVTTDQTVVVAGGTLIVTSTLTVADGAGDDIIVNGTFNFNIGVLNGPGVVNVSGGMEWQSGQLQTNVVLAAGSTNNKTTSGNAFINGNGVLTNNGTFTWVLGDIYLTNGTINNGGTINAIGDNMMSTQGGANGFVNSGTFTKSAGTGTTSIQVNGSSSGTFNVNEGTVSMSGASFTNTGAINVASGKTFLVNGGNFFLGTGSNSTGAGKFQLSAGIVTVDAPAATPATASNVLFSNGIMNGAGTLSVSSGMEWQSGQLQTNVVLATGSTNSKTTGNNAFINGNGVLTNNGTFTWVLGDIYLTNGTINNGGTVNVTGDNMMSNQGGTHNFVNSGTFTKSAGTGTTSIQVNGSSSGTFNVNEGTVSVSGGSFTNTGAINVAGGKTFLVNGGNFFLGTGSNSTGAGKFELSAGTVTVDAPATASNVLFSNGIMNGAGTLSVSSGMEWQSGQLQTNVVLAAGSTNNKTTGNNAFINGNGVLTNNGTFTWVLGDIYLTNGTINNGGTVNVTGDNMMSTQGGANGFVNSGTFTKSAGTGTTSIQVNGSSSGTFNVNEGTVSVSGGSFTNTGAINVADGKTFLVNGGNFFLGTGSNSTGAGKFQLSAGIVTVDAPAATPATATNVLFSNGIMNGAGTLSVSSGMEWQSGQLQTNVVLAAGSANSKTTGNNAFVNGNGVLTNNGTFTWVLGDIYLTNGTINNGGSINATGDNMMSNQGGSHSFVNTGIFTKSAGAGTTSIQVNGSSSGTFNVNEGTVSVSGGSFTNTGAINVAGGKTFLVNGGNFFLGTGSNSTGAGKFQLSAGIVTVDAPAATPATASNVLFSNGIMNGAGTLSVSSGMEWQSGQLQTNVVLAAGSANSKTTGNNAFVNGNGVLTNNGTFTWVLGDIYLTNGTINNGGTVNVTGDNMMSTLGGTHNFVNSGTLMKSSTGTTIIGVATSNTGTIKGIGTFNFTGSFTNNGIIAPGTSPGILTFDGAQPFSPASTLQIELLNSSGAGTGNDQLVRNGSLALDGTLTVTETGTLSNGVYTIINLTSGTISGTFAAVNLPVGYTLQINTSTVTLTRNVVTPTAHQKPGSGNGLSFDGVNDQVVLGNTFTDQNFTVEMWVKPGGSQNAYADIIDNNHTGNQNWVVQQDGGILNRYVFGVHTTAGGTGIFFNLTADVWQHLTLIKSPSTIEVYVNGVLIGSTAWSGTVNYVNPSLILGNWASGGRNWNGQMDEVRIWNTALTQAQIRDRMCHKVTTSDALYSNLVGYYNFDESSGTIAFDGSATVRNGTLVNDPARVTSGAAIGNASAHDYVNSSKTVTLAHATGESFIATSTSGSPDGIHVYVVNEQPNTLLGTTGVGINDKYFGVFQTGGTSPTYVGVYNYTGSPFLTVSNEPSLRLFSRNNNASPSWSQLAAVPDEPNNTITVSGQTTEYILGTDGTQILPLKLISFTGNVKAADAQLQWRTANEVNLAKFEVQSSTDGRNFSSVGTLPAGSSNYTFTDPAIFNSTSVVYYRLKSVDNDGKFAYSTIIRLSNSRSMVMGIFPNPTTDFVTISGLSQKGIIKLFGVDGKLLVQQTVSAQTITLDVTKLVKGTYVLQYLYDGKAWSQTIIKQ